MWNMYKVNNKTTKTTNIEHFSFEHISHLCSSVSIVNFEQVNAGWDAEMNATNHKARKNKPGEKTVLADRKKLITMIK